MREYGQIQVAFWSDPDIQRLQDGAKLLFCYLLTGPHSNSLGCYHLPFGYVAEDLGISTETVSKRFQNLSDAGFIKYCQDTKHVLIHNYLKWNPIANGNVGKRIEKDFNKVPKKSSIYEPLAHQLYLHANHLQKAFQNSIETVSERYRNNEPTQTHPEPTQTKPNVDQARPVIDEQVAAVFAYWQERLGHPKARLDIKRAKSITAALDLGYQVDDLKLAIDGCANTPHNMGKNATGQIYDDLGLILRDGDHVDRFMRNSKIVHQSSGVDGTRANLREMSGVGRIGLDD